MLQPAYQLKRHPHTYPPPKSCQRTGPAQRFSQSTAPCTHALLHGHHLPTQQSRLSARCPTPTSFSEHNSWRCMPAPRPRFMVCTLSTHLREVLHIQGLGNASFSHTRHQARPNSRPVGNAGLAWQLAAGRGGGFSSRTVPFRQCVDPTNQGYELPHRQISSSPGSGPTQHTRGCRERNSARNMASPSSELEGGNVSPAAAFFGVLWRRGCAAFFFLF